MRDQTWWEPGLKEGLVSRRWVQLYVFPVPALGDSELQTSLRYRAQALLPSPDLPVTIRSFRHKRQRFGLVIVDRLPDPRPDDSQLTIGVPLLLPPNWPSECLLAVASPEGWEIQSYKGSVLTHCYPPAQSSSPLVDAILGQHSELPVFWTSPDPAWSPAPPTWGTAPPPWKGAGTWGTPWVAKPEPRWPWVLTSVFLVLGFAAWISWGVGLLQAKHERNDRLANWLQTATGLVEAPALVAQKRDEARNLVGEPIETILEAMADSWPSGVEVRRLEVASGRVLITARAKSALAAVAALAQNSFATELKLVQIRPYVGGDEFDLAGRVSP